MKRVHRSKTRSVSSSSTPKLVSNLFHLSAVWPGDMGIAVPAQFVSTHDLIPTRNALATMFAHINPRTGALPESGPPLSQLDSGTTRLVLRLPPCLLTDCTADTYHAWTLIGTRALALR